MLGDAVASAAVVLMTLWAGLDDRLKLGRPVRWLAFTETRGLNTGDFVAMALGGVALALIWVT